MCSYATPSSRKKAQSQGGSGSDDMQNRIDRLEGLVLSLMHGGANIDVSPVAAASTVAARSTTDSGSSARIDGGDDSAMPDEDEGEEEEDSDIDDGLATSLGVLKGECPFGRLSSPFGPFLVSR